MKTIVKRKTSFIFLLFILCLSFNFTHATKTQEKASSIKKISAAEKSFLDSLFIALKKKLEGNILLIVKMNIAHDTAIKVLDTLNPCADEENKKLTPKEEKRLVDICKQKLLKPTNQFLNPLYDFKTILEPFVEIILRAAEETNSNKEKEEYLLSQFFQQDKKTAPSFFENTLATREKTIKACEEFIILCATISAEISEEAKKKADDKAREIINKQKEAAAAKQKKKN